MSGIPATKPVRLFLAVDPNPEIIAQFEQTIAQLRLVAPHARWVRAEKLHVTLVFLGDVEQAQIATIRDIMHSVVALHDPFQLRFAHGGSFGETKHPRVLWAGIGGDMMALRALQKTLADKLEPLGFKPEHREYAPHLTLARSADPRGDESLVDCRNKLAERTFGETLIREVVLYESVQGTSGSTYAALVRAPLRT